MATRHGFLVWIKIGSHGGMAWYLARSRWVDVAVWLGSSLIRRGLGGSYVTRG